MGQTIPDIIPDLSYPYIPYLPGNPDSEIEHIQTDKSSEYQVETSLESPSTKQTHAISNLSTTISPCMKMMTLKRQREKEEEVSERK